MSRRFYLACATIAVAAIGSIAWAEYAEAQTAQCAPAAKFIADLKEKYSEVKVGGGMVGDAVIVGIFASPGGDTWTILRFMSDGSACGLAAGTNLVLRPLTDNLPGVPS